MLRAVAFSHQLLQAHVQAGDMVIDATAGNGHDTLFLARLAGPDGRVFAFDVQAAAVAATRSLLVQEGVPMESYEVIHAGHETMREAIPAEWHGKAAAVLFNLGYLPGGDKSLTTVAASTLEALRAALAMLRPRGLLVAVLYTGHPAGAEEASAVQEWAGALPSREFHAVEYRTLNARLPAPSVLAVQIAG